MSMSRLGLYNRCVVLAAIALSLQNAAQAQLEKEACTLLIYQVGDLVPNVRDYPCPDASGSALTHVPDRMGGMGGGMIGGMGGMGGGVRAAREDRSSSPGLVQITMDDLEQALTSVVEPKGWDAVGGRGSVQQLGTSLLVSQTAAVHQQIRNFLKQLREGSGERRTVAVDARWLFLDSDELDHLIPPDETGRPQVDRKMLAVFTRRPSSIRGVTNCFSGQLVYLVSGTRRNVVSSYIPVVGSLDRPEQRAAHYASLKGGARYTFISQNTVPGAGMQSAFVGGSGHNVGYQPIVEKPTFGALLEIRPTVASGEDMAIVDLRSTFTVPGEESASLVGQPPIDHLAPAVDRIAIETQELATTLRMPLGHPVLVGGLTCVPPSIKSLRQKAKTDATQPQAAATETPQLYLIVELR